MRVKIFTFLKKWLERKTNSKTVTRVYFLGTVRLHPLVVTVSTGSTPVEGSKLTKI